MTQKQNRKTSYRTATAKHKARILVVPSRKNQYRPKLVSRYGFLAVGLVGLILQFGYNGVINSGVLGSEASSLNEQTLLDRTNSERQLNGANSLSYSDKLAQAAALKVDDMFTNQYWAHDSPQGKKPWAWLDSVGYVYSVAGENLAKDFDSADAAVRAWMASDSHRKNILDNRYTEAGFAIKSGRLNGNDATIVVALYGEPVAQKNNGLLLGGSASAASFSSAVADKTSLMDQFGLALASLTPAALASITLLLLLAVIALIAHAYRRRMPKAYQKTWQKHHGAIKAALSLAAVLITIWMYAGGQV